MASLSDLIFRPNPESQGSAHSPEAQFRLDGLLAEGPRFLQMMLSSHPEITAKIKAKEIKDLQDLRSLHEVDRSHRDVVAAAEQIVKAADVREEEAGAQLVNEASAYLGDVAADKPADTYDELLSQMRDEARAKIDNIDIDQQDINA